MTNTSAPRMPLRDRIAGDRPSTGSVLPRAEKTATIRPKLRIHLGSSGFFEVCDHLSESSKALANYSQYVRTELLRHKGFSLGEPNCDTTVQESGPPSRDDCGKRQQVSERHDHFTAFHSWHGSRGGCDCGDRKRANQRHPTARTPWKGGTDIGPRDVIRDRENPDVLVPPATDSGTLPNLNFSLRMLSKYSL
jgi:hypothetical protein